MVNETHFIVRISGKRQNSFYIDYLGAYTIADISRHVGVKQDLIAKCYISNGAVHDLVLDVYYFGSTTDAKKAISEILKNVKTEARGKVVHLTDVEIEYLRKALINEGVNTIHVKNSIKDAIFKKLNG